MSNSVGINLNNVNISVQIIENMYTIFVQNRICKHNNKFYCYLCKYLVDDLVSILKHVTKDKEHQERNKIGVIKTNMLKNLKIDEIKSVEIVLNGIVSITLQQFHCIICSCNIPTLSHINDHIKGHNHSTNKNEKPTSSNDSTLNSTSKNFNNDKTESISIINDVEPIIVYYCTTCGISLKNNAAVKYHKMFHLSPKLRSSCSNIDVINFSIQEENLKYLHCVICDSNIHDEDELEKHLEEINHKKWIIFLHRSKEFSDDVGEHSISFDDNITSTTTIYKNLYCQVCDIRTPFQEDHNSFTEHLNGKRHKNKLLSFLMQNQMLRLTSITDDCLPIYTCFLCTIEFTEENSLYNHYKDNIHQYRVRIINLLLSDKSINIEQINSEKVIQCKMCKIEVANPPSMLSHILGAKHKKKLKQNICKASTEINSETRSTGSNNVSSVNKISSTKSSLNLTSLPKDNNNKNIYIFLCPICEVNVKYDYMLIDHLKSKNHKKKVIQYNENANSTSLKDINFFCPICEDTFCNDMQVLEHFFNINHKSNVHSKLSNKSSSTNSENLSFKSCNSTLSLDSKNNEGMHSDDLNDPETLNSVINKLIDFEINGDHDNSLPSMKKKRNGRRSKYLSTFGEQYITLCLEPGENNIFNVNSEKIHKMQLGINLTIPFELVRLCIPCGTQMSSNPQLIYEHLHNEEHMKKFQEIMDNHKSFENYEDQFSDLKLAESYMENISGELVLCFACNVMIRNFDISIQSHVKTETHINKILPLKKSTEEIFKRMTNILHSAWYFAEKFVCEICTAKFNSDIEFAHHLKQEKHLKNVSQVKVGQDVLQFDMCASCVTYWYGKANCYTVHCNGSFHKYLLKSQFYTIPNLMAPVEYILNCYEYTIDCLLQQSDSIDHNIEKEILKSVQEATEIQYPQAIKAHLFGSRLSYLASCDSDLDIYLDCGNSYYDLKPLEEIREQLLRIEKCFQGHVNVWIIEAVLLNARVPIIKLRHISTNLDCDISCTNGLSVEKSKLIKYIIKAYPTCRKLILFLKNWMSLCGLSGVRGITTFAISMLTIFYLQIEGILPSVDQLIKQQNQSSIIAGWETGFVKKIPITKTDHSVKYLLSRLFAYYADFHYTTDVICPFLGKPIKKRTFVNLNNLPEEMINYKHFCRNDNTKLFRFDSPMCVQDPIELSENSTRIVTKLQLRTFKEYCSESSAILAKNESDHEV